MPARKHPPKDAAERIEKLAADGYSVVGIAAALGVAAATLNRWMRDVKMLREALDRGREKERLALHSAMREAAIKKHDVRAAQFLLRSVHGYSDEQPDSGGRVSVTIALPGALTVAQFNASLEKATDAKKLVAADSDQSLPKPRARLTRGV